jgi:putative NADPH-quinone reductase
MTPKRIFVLNGHPGQTSLCRSLAERYADAAREAGHEVRITHLSDLDFDMDYGLGGYKNAKIPEPDLEAVIENIEWCQHLVTTAPLWWGNIPAKLKGLFDRALLPGRAFDTRNTTALGLPKPLLTGRTVRLIMTADTPRLLLALMYGNAILRQLKGQVFTFVGFKPMRTTWLSGTSHPKQGAVDKWFKRLDKLGAQAA